MNTFVDWDDLRWEDVPSGATALVVDTATPTLERLDVRVHRIEPGATWESLAIPAERIFLVRSGDVAIDISGSVKAGTGKTTGFVRSGDTLRCTNTGNEPAEVFVTTFTTAEANDPAQHNPAAESLASTVLTWEEGAVEYGSEASTHKSKFIERRVFLPPSRTLTSPRVTIHAQIIDPSTPEVHYGGHPDVCLFFMLTGGFHFTVPDATHDTGAGSFFYMEEEAPHGQIPFEDGVTTYFVLHIWSSISLANALASGYPM